MTREASKIVGEEPITVSDSMQPATPGVPEPMSSKEIQEMEQHIEKVLAYLRRVDRAVDRAVPRV